MKKRKQVVFVIFALFFVSYLGSANAQSPDLNCYVQQTGCNAGDTPVFKMQNYTNAHAELVDQTNYDWWVCCNITGQLDLGTSCDLPVSDVAVRLSDYTNAHVEASSSSVYPWNICLSSTEPSVPGLFCMDTAQTECPIYSVCLASLSNPTSSNAHVGNCTAYPAGQVCCAVLIDTTDPFTFDNTTNDWYNDPQAIKLSCTDPLDPVFDAASGCLLTDYCLSQDGMPCTPNIPAPIESINHPDIESVIQVPTTNWIYYYSIDKAGNQEDDKLSANQVKICDFKNLTITPHCDIIGPPGTCENGGDYLEIVANYSDGCPKQDITQTTTQIDLDVRSTNPECELVVSTVCGNPQNCGTGTCECTGNWLIPDFDGTVCADKTLETGMANLTEDGTLVIDSLSPPEIEVLSFNTTGFHSSFELNDGDPYSTIRDVTADINTSISTPEMTNFTKCDINWLDGNITHICDSVNETNTPFCQNPLLRTDVPYTYDFDGPKQAILNCTANDPGETVLISPSNTIFLDSVPPEVNPYANPNPTPSRSPTIYTGLFDTFPSSLFNDTGYCVAEGGDAVGGGGLVTWGCFLDPDGFITTCDIISGELTLGPHNINVTCNDNAGEFDGRANVSNNFTLYVDNTQPLCIMNLQLSAPPFHDDSPLPISWTTPYQPREFNLKWNETWVPGGDISEISFWNDFDDNFLFEPDVGPNPVPPTITSTNFTQASGTFWFSCNVTDFTTNVTGDWTQPLKAVIDRIPPLGRVNPLQPYYTYSVGVSWFASQIGDSGVRSFDVQFNSSNDPAWGNWLIETPSTSGTFGNGNPIFLESGVKYCFRVRVTNNALVTGEWSDHVCMTADLTPPSITVSVRDIATGRELVDSSQLPYIISGTATLLDIVSTATEEISELESHTLQITDPLEGLIDCGSANTCQRLGFDLEAAGGQADFRVTATDNVSNFAGRDFFIVPNALANFNIDEIFMVLGESIDVAVSVRNLKAEPDIVHLELDPDDVFTTGIAVFLDNNEKMMNISLLPNEKKTVFVKLIGTDVGSGGGEPLNLSAVSEIDSEVTANDTLRVIVVFPAAFPGLGIPGIILMVLLSVLIYVRFISKKEV